MEKEIKYIYPENHYLPTNYEGNEEEVVNYEGYTCLLEECYNIDREYYHKDHDINEFTYDDHSNCYILNDDSCDAIYNSRDQTQITHQNNCIEIDDDWYIKDYVDNGNIDKVVCTYNNEYYLRECCIWSDVTDAWYRLDDNNIPYDDDDDEENNLFDYHSNNTEDYSNDSKFKIGFEIEKSQMPSFNFCKQDILNNTGFVLERDGSVESGFELISPILDLYDQKILSHFEKVRDFIDIPHVNNAGGHINVSIKGKTSEETLLALNGWLPLIYALYKGRANGTYSKVKKVSSLLTDTDKYQSVRTKSNGIVEFRIISAVREFKQLEFRIKLFQIMFENLGTSFLEVLQLVTDPKHKLYKLLTQDIYKDLIKFNSLVTTAIKFERDLEGVYTIKQIEKATKKLKKPKIIESSIISTKEKNTFILGSNPVLNYRTISSLWPLDLSPPSISGNSNINYVTETDLDNTFN